MAPNLFTPIQIGNLQLKNRIVMAPLTRTRAGPTHVPNQIMKEYYAQRASAGLIIAECTMIAPNTSAFVGEPGVYTNEQLLAWKEATDAVHANGGKIFLQIWHAGRAAHPDNNDGTQPVAPSAIAIEGGSFNFADAKPHVVPRALPVDEIATIVQQFATAAKNSVEIAGFDGVELHAANGYLIDSFLRSSANNRTDQYGGSLENRARFLTEVIEAVAGAVGAGKLGIRISPLNSENSMKDEDPIALSEHVAKLAQRYDLGYVHLIRRDFVGILKADIEPIFRQHFHNTLISNTRYTKDEANEAIESGRVDAVAFGIPFIANPDLPERFAKDAPLSRADRATFYVGGAKGYTDYPPLSKC
ncbi:hypothetical protein LEN26_015173 [Aphanomyces euteiches]|nr:hypothetical protein AeMF1_020719 [Aphanomyces euteiches]KAH9103869.1 hypothetical protein LEN26_015173 [Aphanomyces euteiches]KAH9188883.1 hypothetical protein AeNC1_009135 [Aphanomyces euteiches]